MDTASRLIVIADIVDSRSLDPETRRGVQARIRELAEAPLQFRFAGGDEFEWALPDEPASLDTLLRFRAALGAGDAPRGLPSVALRCGLGRGVVTVGSPDGPYAEDGPAYHRARAAYDVMRREPARQRRSQKQPFEPTDAPDHRRTTLDDGRGDPVQDALLLFMDEVMTQWSRVHWEAIDHVLRGTSYEDAAQALGVSTPAVFKRLKSARLNSYLVGHKALKARWDNDV
ncbi:MAG: hypothetical protein CVU56_07140 [Deltaproteobacteria bacterium HGW-Deltaproteobacteria-14]|jgi:hypothetical protein|nr:MAG: hypothetical protein CVU56_07140 [Deltaproteobacteria bacterium HGW-Deltaproteobacteria-14]